MKSKSNISFKDSIKTKLITIMVAVAAVPLIIAIVVSYNTSTTKARNDALDILAAQASTVEQEYSGVLKQNISALQTFAYAHSTQEYLATRGTPNQKITDEDMLFEFDKLNSNINDGNTSMAISLPTGDQILRADRKELVSIGERDYFQECISSGKPVISNIVTGKTTGNRVTNIIVPIYNKEGTEILGTIHRSYNLNNLHNFLIEHVDDGYICDRNGIVAAHAQFDISADDEPLDMSSANFMSTSDTSGIEKMTFDGSLTYTCWIKEPTSGFIVAVSRQNKQIMASAVASAMVVVIIGVILIIIAVILSFLMANSFTQPIAAVNESLGALADGRFVKVEKFHNRKDEFGAISNATNSVISTLDNIVTGIKDSATRLGSSSEELSNMANQISKTTADVSRAVQEIASGATQQADEIQSATENVGQIGVAISDVQNSADDLSNLSSKMKEASEISSKSLTSLQDSSTEMTAKIDDISNTIQSTQNAVNNISEKVEGITSIATQTNLLSLNASIEAARAGEAGRGFAVVAEEIGTLANDSRQMADDIRKEMNILLEQSKAAVLAAEDVQQGNNEQQVALGETLESVNGMLDDIRSTVDGVKLISQGAQTCDSSKNAVVDTMSALSAISEENAASSEETGASMQELSSTVTILAGSANNLREIAEKLNEDMQFFKS